MAEALDVITLPTCVASSGSHEKMRHTLGRTGLYERFAGRIFSATEVARGKPAPDLFLHAARRMGIDPAACAVVEDSRPGIAHGDKGYDSNANREELRKRGILPVISRQGAPNIKGSGRLRSVVEQTFALLHGFKRLAVRWERRTELHDAFVSLACSLICWRRLKRGRS